MLSTVAWFLGSLLRGVPLLLGLVQSTCCELPVAPLGFQFRYLHLCNLLVLYYLGVNVIAIP